MRVCKVAYGISSLIYTLTDYTIFLIPNSGFPLVGLVVAGPLEVVTLTEYGVSAHCRGTEILDVGHCTPCSGGSSGRSLLTVCTLNRLQCSGVWYGGGRPWPWRYGAGEDHSAHARLGLHG